MWELISINAIPKGSDSIPDGTNHYDEESIKPRRWNKALYKTEEWAESVQFWQKYAAIDLINI